jgi:broad specificity phosphatase PhoE
VVPELNEISWGDYEGKESNPGWKVDYYRMIEGWGKGELHLSVPNGESPLQLQERQRKALDILLKDKDVKTALVCMHGRAMKGFLCLLLNKPLTEMEDFSHSNLCLYKLEYKNGHFELVKANCIEHLDERMSA